MGHRLPPWFFLMPSYWRDPKLDYVDEKLLAHLLAAGEQKVRHLSGTRLEHAVHYGGDCMGMCCTIFP